MIISKHNAAVNRWGKNSVAYLLCNSEHLSVKHEVVPAGDSEVMHYHESAMQCFFVLKGNVEIIIDDEKFSLCENDSITVLPGRKHLIKNVSLQTAEFLVISQPRIDADRINIC